MVRKFVIAALITLALPLCVAAVAGAEQYPPDVDGTTIPRDIDDDDPPTSVDPSGADPSEVGRSEADPAEAAAPQAAAAPESTAPLARTGTDTGVLIAAGLVLVVGGGVAVASTRRRRALG